MRRIRVVMDNIFKDLQLIRIGDQAALRVLGG